MPNAAIQGWRLSRLIRQNGFHIVQTFHQKSDTYGALIARLSGAKHIISSKRDTGALRRPWHRFLNRRLKSLFDAWIAVSEAVRVAAIRNDRLSALRVTTIYNGVDTAQFTVPSVAQRSVARAALGFAAGDFVVGIVARFRPEKSHEVFFKGLERALPAIPQLKALAVGNGPLLNGVRELIGRTKMGMHTVFTGDVADVVPYLWAMDVGVLTSRSNEGFSNGVLEQMAVGLPMIVTDVGGNAEAVSHTQNGIVIPPMQPEALSAAVIELHSDSYRREVMGRESRKRVEERFTVEKMCEEHMKLYISVLSRERHRNARAR